MTKEIDGVYFHVIRKGTKTANSIQARGQYWSKDWDELYTRPSEYKTNTKIEWENWINDHNGYILGYTGNTFLFTIYGVITLENQKQFIQITKDYNRIIM